MFLVQPGGPDPQTLLDRVVAQVEDYNRTLPRITADEVITSDLMQHGFYRAHGRATATIRVFSTDGGKSLEERRTYLTKDGKPLAPGPKQAVPFELTGAFSHMAGVFLSVAHRPCYLFTPVSESPATGITRFRFETNPHLPAGCNNKGVVLTGELDVDTATAQIRKLERTVLAVPDGKPRATVISIEFAPAVVGNQTFWLPTSLYAEYDKGQGHFRATYSNYHQYTSSVTLLPGVVESSESTADPQ